MAVKTERKLSTPFAKYCCLTRFGARHCNSMFTTVSAADLQCMCVSSDRLTSVYRYEFSMGKWFHALSWAMVLHSCCCMHHVPHETSQSLAVSSAMCTRIPPSNLARGHWSTISLFEHYRGYKDTNLSHLLQEGPQWSWVMKKQLRRDHWHLYSWFSWDKIIDRKDLTTDANSHSLCPRKMKQRISFGLQS